MRLLLLVLLACVVRTPSSKPTGGQRHDEATARPGYSETWDRTATNVLILVLDDIGPHSVKVYDEGEARPKTPVIDKLARDGVLFRNGYSYPTCSAARAALLTGRYARRTGMGDALMYDDAYQLRHSEVLLPELLAKATGAYTSAAIGKWHLAGSGVAGWKRDALDQGFRTHEGSPSNIHSPFVGLQDATYTHYEKLENGNLTVSGRYATTEAVDDTLEAIERMPEPWLAWVAFNAPHDPFHVPPDRLNETGVTESDTRMAKYQAMITAMDAEIGRLLDSMEPAVRDRTMVFVIGDNGAPPQVIPPPFNGRQAKFTLYEGGTNVPFIVSGAGVRDRGSESKALVHVVDVFPTVAGLAHVSSGRRLDGYDLGPLLADADAPWPREFLFTERFLPNGPGPWTEEHVAVRDERYKWMEVRKSGEPVERYLFDLKGRIDDGPNLLDGPLDDRAKAAKKALQAALASYEQIPYDGAGEPKTRPAPTQQKH